MANRLYFYSTGGSLESCVWKDFEVASGFSGGGMLRSAWVGRLCATSLSSMLFLFFPWQAHRFCCLCVLKHLNFFIQPRFAPELVFISICAFWIASFGISLALRLLIRMKLNSLLQNKLLNVFVMLMNRTS